VTVSIPRRGNEDFERSEDLSVPSYLFQSLVVVGAMRTGPGPRAPGRAPIVSIPRRGNEDLQSNEVFVARSYLFQSLVGAMRTCEPSRDGPCSRCFNPS